MSYKSIQPEQVKFVNVGDSVEGVLASVEDTEVSNKPAKRYTIATTSGLKSFLGTYAMNEVLPDHLEEKVKITFAGEIKTNAGRTMRNFSIEAWEEDASKAKK